MADRERELARVESTHLGLEDHGVYTLNVNFRGKTWGQGIGHYVVSQRGDDGQQHAVNGYGMEFVIRLLSACSVTRWEDLPGALCWIVRENDRIVGVEPLEVNDGQAFYFADLRTDEA